MGMEFRDKLLQESEILAKLQSSNLQSKKYQSMIFVFDANQGNEEAG